MNYIKYIFLFIFVINLQENVGAYQCIQDEAQFIGTISHKESFDNKCRMFIAAPIQYFKEHILCPIFLEELLENGFIAANKYCKKELGSQISGVLIRQDYEGHIWLEE